jgi:hypothetical protein
MNALINTPLQRGVTRGREVFNRFSGFSRVYQTVETVRAVARRCHTPLKRRVNQKEPASPCK